MVTSTHSQPATISATTVHRKFSEVIRRVVSNNEEIIVERDGLPVLVFIPVSTYEQFLRERQLQEEQERRMQEIALQFREEARRRGMTEDQLMAELKKK